MLELALVDADGQIGGRVARSRLKRHHTTLPFWQSRRQCRRRDALPVKGGGFDYSRRRRIIVAVCQARSWPVPAIRPNAPLKLLW
jgi:hypothetical protein